MEIEKLIDLADPVYTFCEVMDHVDLSRYFVEKDYKAGRPRCDAIKLLKVILFAFMEHTYIDGTKIEANANRYTWVWKKSCVANRNKVFEKITQLIKEMNSKVLSYQGVKLETRQEYAVE